MPDERCGGYTDSSAAPAHSARTTPGPPGLCSCMPRNPETCPSPQSRLTENHGQAVTPSETSTHTCPVMSLPEVPPGGSRQTTASAGTPGSGGTFEGKVHFINQPIVGLPSTGSSSPSVSVRAVDTDVNCQGCPPPPSWGVLQARHKALCRNASHWPLARTKIATPTELPKLD